MSDPLIFNFFSMNTANHMFHGMWRHPGNQSIDYNNLEYWVKLCQLMERGGFDNLFCADVIGIDPAFRGSEEIYCKEAVQFPVNDASTLISALIGATETFGLSFTSSIIQEHPFNFARRVSTMDHLSKGRIGWNIVTGASINAHQNFGAAHQTKHDERYAWADEYMEVLYKLWEGSWEEDAFLRDRDRGIFSDHRKVHRINHEGKRYKVRGPHTPSPSPQRTPTLFQAGASSTGRAFAARHAEGTFIVAVSPQSARKLVKETNQLVEQYGRKKGDLKYIQGLSFVVGSTEEEAQRLAREWDEYNSVEGAMAHISRDINIDLGSMDPSTPVSSVNIEGLRGIVTLVEDAMPGKVVTIGDVGQVFARNTRVIGTPESIADTLEVWRDAGIDGINVVYQTSPRSFVDFIEHVMPVLRKRGLAREAEVKPATLRERMFPGRGPRLNERHPAAQYRPGGPKHRLAPLGHPTGPETLTAEVIP